MSAELDIVRLKVTRAEKHFEDFKAQVGVGPNAKKLPEAAYTEVNYDAGTLTYISLAPIPSPEARIILGDSLHQLRSALDHMVCALAMRTNPRSVCEDSKLQFPIFKSARDFGADWRVSKGVYEELLGNGCCGEGCSRKVRSVLLRWVSRMPVVIESKTPQFGLRDFLFYFVPGGVVLISILLCAGIGLEEIGKFDGLLVTATAVFASYFLGQCVYPLSSLLRRWFDRKNPDLPAPDEFSPIYMSLIEEHTAFYSAIVFRDRSFARFANAMVVPSLILGIAFAWRLGQSGHPWWAAVSSVIGGGTVGGFLHRYTHYEKRYRRALRRYEEVRRGAVAGTAQ